MPRKNSGLTVRDLAKLLPVGESTIYRWIKDDIIPYVNCRIPLAFAKKLKKEWDKTCTPAEAARIRRVSTSKIDKMLNDGCCFRERFVARKRRIIRESLWNLKRGSFVIKKGDIVHPNRRGFARLTKAKLRKISRMGHEAFKKKLRVLSF